MLLNDLERSPSMKTDWVLLTNQLLIQLLIFPFDEVYVSEGYVRLYQTSWQNPARECQLAVLHRSLQLSHLMKLVSWVSHDLHFLKPCCRGYIILLSSRWFMMVLVTIHVCSIILQQILVGDIGL